MKVKDVNILLREFSSFMTDTKHLIAADGSSSSGNSGWQLIINGLWCVIM